MSAREPTEPLTPVEARILGDAGITGNEGTIGTLNAGTRASVMLDATALGRVGPVEVLVARTGRPWSIGVEAVAVSVGVHGPGNLGAAMRRAIPSLSLESSFERVTPDAADLIEVNDSTARALRAVIAVSVRDEKLTRSGEPDANAETVRRAVRTVLARADAAVLHSLALPLMGGGAVGLNTTLVADAVVGVVVEVLSTTTTSLNQLVFVCLDDHSTAEVRSAWERLSDVPRKTVAADQSISSNSADVTLATQFDRLSPSSRAAFGAADWLRTGMGRRAVHMEHLLVGLAQNSEGPTRRLLAEHGISLSDLYVLLASVVEFDVPPSITIEPATELPPLSGHVERAVRTAIELAIVDGSTSIRSRHLLAGVLSVTDCDVVAALAERGVHGSKPPIGKRPQQLAGASADTIPAKGHVRSADRLGTAADVEMLVSVLLAKDTPLPLAVGLFGDWGSGKSFFMAHMEERAAALAKLAADGEPAGAPFCAAIKQIRFNAWHYADADLWASLASALFDELADPGESTGADENAKLLKVAQDRVTVAETARRDLETEVLAMEASSASIGSMTRAVARRAVRRFLDTAAPVTSLEQAVKTSAPSETAPTAHQSRVTQEAEQFSAAVAQLRQVSGTVGTLWQLAVGLFRGQRRAWTLGLAMVLLAGAFAYAVFTQAAAVTSVLSVLAALAAAASPVLVGAVRVLQLTEEVSTQAAQPLEEKRRALDEARATEEKAQLELAKQETQLRLVRDRGYQLKEFVRARAASSVYRDKLGVISQVRMDFSELVRLLQQPADTTAALGMSGVERIVLYIDDLDRCPQEKVVDVLQAVHLLLAFQLFVVVVGVDSRWLARSLEQQFPNLLLEPQRYLEKIFQIPFALTPRGNEQYPRQFNDLIMSLTTPSGRQRSDGGRSSAGPTSKESADNRSAESTGGEATEQNPSLGEHNPPATRGTETGSTPPAPPLPTPRPEALDLTEGERNWLGRLAPVVPTPRAAKRLVNIYRMLRVGVSEAELSDFLPDSGNGYRAVAVLVAIMVGCPDHADRVFDSIRDCPTATKLSVALADDLCWQALSDLHMDIDTVPVPVFQEWLPRVTRFSFRLDGSTRRPSTAADPTAPDTATAEKQPSPLMNQSERAITDE